MYYVYILHSVSSDKYYIGSAENLEDRLAQHKAGRNKSTKHGIPWRIAYTESFVTELKHSGERWKSRRRKAGTTSNG